MRLPPTMTSRDLRGAPAKRHSAACRLGGSSRDSLRFSRTHMEQFEAPLVAALGTGRTASSRCVGSGSVPEYRLTRYRNDC